MNYVIVGLGNPDAEYEGTRHNVGRMALEHFRKANKFPEWEFSKNANALYSKNKIGKHTVELLLPETFMNRSGKAVLYAVTKHKIKSENIVVVYDDLDMGLGNIKISFSRGSGGHRGVESVAKALRTKNFVRLRVGISKALASGKIKKPAGEDAVLDFILKKFGKPELEKLKKVFKATNGALETVVEEGKEKAMNKFN